MTELHGEKIDIVDYSEDSAEFVANALSPARVTRVIVVDADARLAHKLTGWKIDIHPDNPRAMDAGGEPTGPASSRGTTDAGGEPTGPTSSRGTTDAPAR